MSLEKISGINNGIADTYQALFQVFTQGTWLRFYGGHYNIVIY